MNKDWDIKFRMPFDYETVPVGGEISLRIICALCVAILRQVRL